MPFGAAATAGALLAAVAAALATLAWIALARRWHVQDEPGQRRLHDQPTPRGGGVGLALGWWLGATTAWAWAIANAPFPWSVLPILLIVTAPFLLCGLLDDLYALPAAVKLALQLLAAGCVLALFLPAGSLQYGLALLAALYLVNAWNFMDGSNGMIAIQSLLLALALATWPGQQSSIVVIASALAGACAGFLPLNFPRARVFLGDAGSLLLGAAVFALLLATCAHGDMTPVQALLLVSVVLLDTALTLARRVLRGRRFWRAHREHLYQYAVRKGHSHAGVALAYGAATVVAWLLALSLRGAGTIRAFVVPTLAWGGAAAAYVLLRRNWLGRRRPPMEGSR